MHKELALHTSYARVGLPPPARPPAPLPLLQALPALLSVGSREFAARVAHILAAADVDHERPRPGQSMGWSSAGVGTRLGPAAATQRNHCGVLQLSASSGRGPAGVPSCDIPPPPPSPPPPPPLPPPPPRRACPLNSAPVASDCKAHSADHTLYVWHKVMHGALCTSCRQEASKRA